MMSHETATPNDRIVLVMTLLASLALIGAATGTLGGQFFGSIIDIIGSLIGGGGGIGSIIEKILGSLF